MQRNILLALVTLVGVVLPVLCHPVLNASAAASAACVAVTRAPTASRRRAMVQLYSDDDAVMLKDISAAVTEMMAAKASLAAGREWRLCVEWADEDEELEAEIEQEVLPDHPTTPVRDENQLFHLSALAPPSLGLTESGEGYAVQVNSLPDAAANASACSSPAGECNLRSAVAYCETISGSINGPCVVKLPAAQTLYMDPGLGHIEIDPLTAGEIALEGNGCEVTTLPHDTESSRLLYVDASSTLSLSISDLTVSQFGDDDLLGGALYLRGLAAVALANIAFQDLNGWDGGALYIDRSTLVVVSNCTFSNVAAQRYGGAIQIYSYTTAAIVSNCTFNNTFAESHGGAINVDTFNSGIVITGCVFHNTRTMQYGGAISVYKNNIQFAASNCEFTAVSAVNGGAISLYEYNTDFVISNCVFHSCSAEYNGGSLYFYTGQDNGEIKNCTFSDSTATHDGGAVYAFGNNDDMTVMYCVFTDTSAGEEGGAILLDTSNIRFRLVNSHFTRFAASRGGALSLFQGNTEASVTSCIFREALWSDEGGAIYAFSGNYFLVVSDCSFVSTHSSENGGALYLSKYNDDVTIKNCHFNGTTAADLGGAIYLHSDNRNVDLLGCDFDSTSAEMGGSIYLGSWNAATTVSQCRFSGVSSTLSGGTAYISSNNDQTRFQNCMFEHAMAGENGGAIYAYDFNENMVILGCTFVNTTALQDGGAIYLFEYSYNTAISDCVFESTSVGSHGGSVYLYETNDGVRISGCNFSESVASYGGAVCLQNFNFDITISGCIFDHTMANGAGGAVFLYANNFEFSVLDCTFNRTVASYDGGAMYFYSANQEAVISGCSFVDNSAAFDGGGIYLYSGNSHLILRDSSLSGISASYGGALFVYVGNFNVSFSRLTIEGNEAVFGGGFYIGNDNSRIVFDDVAIVHNNVSGDGAGVFLQNDNSDIMLTNCRVEGNIAAGFGGGVAMVSLNTGLAFEDCSFIRNTALSGGAIHCSVGNTDMAIYRCLFDSNAATFGGGIYFGDYHKFISLAQVVLRRNSGEYGGAVYITQFNSDLVFVNSTFLANVASADGGGLHLLSEDITLIRCDVFNNEALRGGGVYSKAETIIIKACNISGNRGHTLYGGALIDTASTLLITDSYFGNNSAGSGGALGIIDCVDASVRGTLFVDNGAQLLDGGALFCQSSHLNMSSCTFERNIAGVNGGAVYIVESDSVRVTNSMFNGNSAVTGGGSGVWISTSLTASIVTNIFENNTALSGGGTVYWVYSSMPEPPQVTTANFYADSNTALYGRFVATEATHLYLDPNNNYYVTDYTAAIPHVVAYAGDFYNQTVRTKSLSVVAASVLSTTQCYKSSGYVTGGFVQQFDAGAVNFTTLLAFCDPGYSMPVYLTATGGDEGSMQTSFVLSFRDCVRGEYFADSICTLCEHGTYSVTEPASISSLSALSQQNVCRRCPDGADACYGDTVVLSEGYWRISEVATSTLRCPYDDSCKGGDGTGDELCSDGYEGPVCGVCSDGYSFRSSTQQCEPCSESAGLDAVTILFIVLVGLIGAIAIYCFNSPTFLAKVKTVDDFYILIFSTFGLLDRGVQGSPDEVRIKAGTIRRQFQARVKIYVTLWQIISLLPFTLDLNFPHAYEAIAAVLNVFNLGISVSSLVTCSSVSFDAIDNLVFNTVYPLVVVLALWALRTVHLYLKRSQEPTSLALISGRYFNVFLMFTYLILPFVSVSIFQTFSCADVDPDEVEPGDDRYMSVDYSVSCASSKYEFGFIWAIVFIFVYPVGVPLLYFYVLYSSRSEIMSRTVEDVGETLVPPNARLNSVKLLFEHYQPRLWYWEVLETIHRLLLTGILVVIAQGSGVQIVVGTVAALFFLKIYDIYEPYVDSTVQMLREVCQWQIFFVFFLALLLKADFESVDRSALDGLLVVAMTMNIVVDVSQAVWGRFVISTINSSDVGDVAPVESQKEADFIENVTENPLVSGDPGQKLRDTTVDEYGIEDGIVMSVMESDIISPTVDEEQ